ncbi:hypothetical protein BHE74_00016644 [Ensete ventricosum]|nr:hypothetical protein BHE74_00016644 [Ensete ventricosum]
MRQCEPVKQYRGIETIKQEHSAVEDSMESNLLATMEAEIWASPQELHLQPQPEDVVGGVQEKLLGGQLPPAGHEPTQLPHLPPQRTAYGEPPFPSMDEARPGAARRSAGSWELVTAPSGRLLPSPPVHLSRNGPRREGRHVTSRARV